MGNKMQRKDFRFDKLLAGDYEPQAVSKKKRSKNIKDEYQQMSLFPTLNEEPSDEGELLTSYITDYRRVQDHGE